MTNDAAATAATLNDWIAVGRRLADQRLQLDWAIANWMEEGGRAGHLARLKYNYLSESVGLPVKLLKYALKAAVAFPPPLRDESLSVEHHAIIGSLPQDDARLLLQRAAAERLPARALREAVTQRRYATGENFKDEDVDCTLATQAIRAWNRATPEAREMAFEQFKIAAANGLAIVDEDEAAHV